MKRRLRELLGRSQRGGWRKAGWSLAVLAVFAGSLWFDLREDRLLPNHECSYQQEAHDSEFERLLYGPLVRAHGYLVRHFHRAEQARVVVVTISSPSEPLEVMNNTCKGRTFLAALVKALDQRGAAVIAIDKFFAADSCTEPVTNEEFRSTLRGVNAKVVVGQSTQATAQRRDDKDEDCLVSVQPFDFGGESGGGKGVVLGLTRLNANSLRIPLAWYAYSWRAGGPLQLVPGLALMAAVQTRPKLRSDPVTAWAFGGKGATKAHHPIGALVPLEEVRACDVLPATAPKEGQEVLCPPRTAAAEPVDFHNKTAVIGQLSDNDLQPTPNGYRQGVELQASYVENLLDSDYLKSVPLYLELTVLTLFLLATYLAEFVYEETPRRLALVWCAGFGVLVLLSGIAFLCGYMTPVFLSVSWILCSLIVFRVLGLLRRFSAAKAGFLKGD